MTHNLNPLIVTIDEIQNDLNFSDITSKELINLFTKKEVNNFNSLTEFIELHKVDVDYDIHNEIHKFEQEYFRLSKSGTPNKPYLGDGEGGPDFREIKRHKQEKERNKISTAIRKEFQELLCSKNKKYNKVRTQWNGAVSSILPVLSTAIAGQLGVEAALISGFVAAILVTLCKLPVNAWCRWLSESE